MTPHELKASILQLAIQGKLVEQREEEGTASAYKKQLLSQKEKLFKAKLIKKEREILDQDEPPFEIPDSWVWIRVGDCISNRAGLAYNKGDLDIKGDSMIRVLRGGNIGDMKYSLKPDDVLIASQFVPSELLLKQNMLITPAVTSLEHVGKVGRIDKDLDDAVVGGFVLMLTPHISNDTFAKYLLYAFSSKYFRDCCKGIVNKSGQAFYNLSREKLMNLYFPLPPLAEQKRIVAKLEELLPYIDRYEQAWSKLEDFNKRFPVDMQKSILQMAIQGKLVEQRPEEGTGEELYQQIQQGKQKLIKAGKIKKEKPLPEISEDEKPFEIPESWKWVRLGNVISFQGGYAYKSSSYVISSDNQVIRLGNVKQNLLLIDSKPVFIPEKIANQTEDFRIKNNDILVTMTGTRRKKDYFYVTLVSEKDCIGRNLYLNQRVGCFRSMNGVLPAYLIKVLQNEMIRDVIFKKETGTANQGNLGSEDMKEYVYIPLPPFAEQKRIVAKLEEILPLCERLK